jgi:hypothetical protein
MGRSKLGWNKKKVQIQFVITAKNIIKEFGIDTNQSDKKVEALIRKFGQQKYAPLIIGEGDE